MLFFKFTLKEPVSLILYVATWTWLLLLYEHVLSSMKIQECMPIYHVNFGEELKEIKHFSLHIHQIPNSSYILIFDFLIFDIHIF